MSGIIGILHADGAPVDPTLLREMTASLAFRGPHQQTIWTGGQAGLGCALFRDAPESSSEEQPASLDRRLWIVADARLDARSQLVSELRARDAPISEASPDSHLLLHAFAAWDENCVDRLYGDFAFAIWDSHSQRLFCATDHFGIRKLYFAEAGAAFIFSNTLECVRMHPAVSDRLNEAAITDFLLFGLNCGPDTTSFAEIHRLPRAHTLVWTPERIALREYWRPPLDRALVYKRRRDYLEQFDSVLTAAVRDRIRGTKAGILLSGGLDSSSLAAIACEIREKQPIEIHAFTARSSGSEPDSDELAAKIVAEALQIPLHGFSTSSKQPMEEWDGSGVHTPEPSEDPATEETLEDLRKMAAQAPVAFCGEGSDNLLEFEARHHLAALWREKKFARLSSDVMEHFFRRFWAPDGIRGPLRRFRSFGRNSESKPRFPSWINAELEARLGLKHRWEIYYESFAVSAHPVHPAGYASLFLPQWDAMFEHFDPAYTRAPVRVSYPFLDLRVVRFLLRVPVMPWAFRKFLLRELMRGRLPEKIRMRPKTPVPHDPLIAELRNGGAARLREICLSKEMEAFVNVKGIPDPFPSTGNTEADTAEACLRTRIWSLNKWLQSLRYAPKLPADEQRRAQQPVIVEQKSIRIPCP